MPFAWVDASDKLSGPKSGTPFQTHQSEAAPQRLSPCYQGRRLVVTQAVCAPDLSVLHSPETLKESMTCVQHGVP